MSITLKKEILFNQKFSKAVTELSNEEFKDFKDTYRVARVRSALEKAQRKVQTFFQEEIIPKHKLDETDDKGQPKLDWDAIRAIEDEVKKEEFELKWTLTMKMLEGLGITPALVADLVPIIEDFEEYEKMLDEEPAHLSSVAES